MIGGPFEKMEENTTQPHVNIVMQTVMTWNKEVSAECSLNHCYSRGWTVGGSIDSVTMMSTCSLGQNHKALRSDRDQKTINSG